MRRPERETSTLEQVARRTIDIIVAGGALLVLAPLMVLIAVVIKLTSPGPVVFTQRRVGFGREPFWFYKFRTMGPGPYRLVIEALKEASSKALSMS